MRFSFAKVHFIMSNHSPPPAGEGLSYPPLTLSLNPSVFTKRGTKGEKKVFENILRDEHKTSVMTLYGRRYLVLAKN